MAEQEKKHSGLAELETFECAVYNRKREDRIAENDVALKALHQCLRALREGAGFEGYGRLADAEITRLASAITALFFDPGFKVTQEGFDYMCAERAVLDTVFRASAYGNSDFIYRLVPEDAVGTSKFLLLFSSNSELPLDLETVFRKDPQATIGLYLSIIGCGQVFTKAGHERREALLKLAPIFEDVVLPSHLFNTLCGAYMHCSYASGRDKHGVKRVFHKMLANMLSSVETVRTGPRERSARPRILVLVEWWHSKHAMYRSYAQSIRQLKKDFHLIGACAGANIDREAKDIFDEWIEFDSGNMVLAQVAEQLKAAKPDIVYYPSIGMGIWVIAMASLRLAPIQVMTYGHPATTNSPVIDYGIIEEDCLVADRFSEKMIGLPANTVRPTPYETILVRHVPRKTDTVKIGVAAMQVKITWPFVRALQEVQRRAKKNVEIRFFSAVHGIGLHSMSNDMRGILQNVWIHEQQPYGEYMESLAECDLVAFSFPFGGANSAYDALTLGLPMVSLEGQEPHSRSDASIIRRAGLPESLIAKSEAEYVEIILGLLDDDRRKEVADLTRAVDLEGRFYAPDDSDAFLNAFRSIYRENTVEQAA